MTQPITGYRKLTDEEIAQMNEIKTLGKRIGKLVDKLKANKEYNQRWVELGAIQLQTGLMAITRAVTQPTTF